MSVPTVRQMANQFLDAIVPAGAPPEQRQEMERSFYAGSFAFFTCIIANVAALPDEEAERAMQKLEDELKDYFRLLRTIPGGSEGASKQ